MMEDEGINAEELRVKLDDQNQLVRESEEVRNFHFALSQADQKVLALRAQIKELGELNRDKEENARKLQGEVERELQRFQEVCFVYLSSFSEL